MITHLRGNIEKISDCEIVIDVGGVGYKVNCSQRVIDFAKENMHNALIYTELIIRDISWVLYGFVSEQERFLFNAFTSVQGVGGRIAIALLSALTDDEIYSAFMNDDKTLLCRADGVGERLAARIITELKSKMMKMSNKQSVAFFSETQLVMNDVKSALSNLGYSTNDIVSVLSDPELKKVEQFDTLLKLALNKLYGCKK